MSGAAGAGGIYVHYPFCVHRCPFCDFTLITPREIPHQGYTDSLISELHHRGSTLGGEAQTLYLGGGTPSLWSMGELGRFLEAVRETPGLADGAEITIEANPSEVTDEWLKQVIALGINRVSLGMQSFRDVHLAFMERTHKAADGLRALDLLLASDRISVSMDLIFGVQSQTLEGWREDIVRALALGVPHLSVYGLTVEEGTPLWDRVRKGTVTLPDDEEQVQMMLLARDLLTGGGYVHYEISSYAQPGHRARHNSGYWAMRPYLALGAGAHGFLPPVRYKNDPRVRRYMERALNEPPTVDEEHLSPEVVAFEVVMCGLRDLERGLAISDVHPSLESAVQHEIKEAFLERSGDRVRLTEKGLLFMNDVLLRLTPETI